jgi:hypothetical protein
VKYGLKKPFFQAISALRLLSVDRCAPFIGETVKYEDGV